MSTHTAEIVVGLLVGIALLVWVASRLRVPYPIVLVVGGLVIALIPGLPYVPLRPDVVFLLFLPPLLYSAGLQTSLRDFRANLRPIGLLAIGLVLATTAAVAIVGHYVLGLSWPAAFLLGAIISPPDAVAATTIMQRFRIPKRIVTILEGESLVNDATALVAYAFALEALRTGAFSAIDAAGRFFVIALGGIAVGYVAASIIAALRRRQSDSSVDTLLSLLTPFVAYLPAEWLHCSGVLAVVTAGLVMGRRLPRIIHGERRLRLLGVWDTLILLLNGVVFVLIGLQLPHIVDRLSHYDPLTLATYTLLITFVAIAIRMAWVFPATIVPRFIPAIRRRDSIPPMRYVVLVGYCAMRGIVSLAAAMSLPLVVDGRDGWQVERDLILFLTFGVILLTLVGQGLTLAPLIRAMKLTADDTRHEEEVRLARQQMTHAALARLEAAAILDDPPPQFLARVRSEYEARLGRLYELSDQSPDPSATASYVDLKRQALEAERLMLVQLRDDDQVDDEVLRQLQREVDLSLVALESSAR